MCGSDTACTCASSPTTEPATSPDGTRTVYQIAGMTCGGCAGRVSRQLTDLPGVRDVSVDVASGAVTVTSTERLDDDSVAAAVTAAGYQLVR
ncbi:heavy-metal-associated domain-containing protein [Actinoplanes teichomyceticus]|uniref:Copper chaperone CopZ n=1 Tax=Actinoplanes teichomyceticus TaxID=1867 RepID=A0A561WMJ5_ACTTI|nr:heavy-metal-associated domain-containing protein [Actinoplanes teichomyceticus]TWG25064.1 copper chaperone CopZ [Actinoplanes teichomyceticus]GIF10135.1 hypothetical protein Ate01nite_01670 [Actinoplanes teichomyceticus]